MQDEIITFELATHFLPKIALRLESLYYTVQQAHEEVHPVIHHYALKNLIEILNLVEKPELKSRFLKELMRIEHALIKANTRISSELLARLHMQIQVLTHFVGLFGNSIHNNPFLQSIKQTQQNQLFDCDCHSPQLLLWLESKPELRQNDLIKWLETLNPLLATISIYLSLLRDTAEFNEIEMLNGYYQRPLPAKTSCHLILLRIEKSFGIVPRMQLGHHGLSLRLCEISTMREVRETEAKLNLALCQL